MTSRLAVLAAALLALAMLAGACSSDTADPASIDSAQDSPADAEEAGSLAEDESAGTLDLTEPAPGPVDPTANTVSMVRSLFNLDPTPDQVECILAESEQRPLLAAAIDDNIAFFTSFDDEGLEALTHSLNGCLDPISLGGWATQGVGPQGQTAETAPGCFADAFSDPVDGDPLFHMFVALTFQYRYDPDYTTPMIELLADCTPVAAVAPMMAGQAEAAAGYEIEIDRHCLGEALDDRQVSIEFWTALVDGFAPPITVVEPHFEACSVELYAGMADEVPADFEPWAGDGALAAVKPPARANAYAEPPPMTIDPDAEYTAVLATGDGDVHIRLFSDTAPLAVNNFVNLARDGFYDQTVFHRVIDGFMAQGGDPTGTGTSGPGYRFADEFDGGSDMDRAGLLAMANSGPDTNGSQFFITFAAAEHLNGAHTIFGEVVEGQDVVDAIERRDPALPSGRGQVLESVTIIEE